MSDMEELLIQRKKEPVALYGLGTETERFLARYGEDISVIGLLDGFREDGEMYGFPIISIQDAVGKGIGMIIVIARPGSCRTITKRIGKICLDNHIALYDVRGRNLLAVPKVSYDFRQVQGGKKRELLEKIENADVISFDLFDTLITRKVLHYTDVFEMMDCKLREMGICIPDFIKIRLAAEKELSKDGAPKLEKIYEDVLKRAGGTFLSAGELSEIEWEVDFSTMLPREDVCGIYRGEVSRGSCVVIVTDTYYSKERIECILEKFGLRGCSRIMVSCELGSSKVQSLYKILLEMFGRKKILHIGDDELADIEKASENGMDTYHIYSGWDLFDAVDSFGMDDYIETFEDRLKAGMFVSNLFNSPFQFEDDDKRISVSNAQQIGYLFCAPMITDFVLWLKEKTNTQHLSQILFCARDGYLLGRLFRETNSNARPIYFLTSRAAAIRAGMKNDDDIAYVDSMKYSGSSGEALYARFGIEESDLSGCEKNQTILKKAKAQLRNYQKYIEKLDIRDENLALFDFVAKGTTQMYLQRMFRQHVKGFYFLQLEPEFMADKELDIEPFYSDKEKDENSIFNNYYILETILTSPYSQMMEFDDNGVPKFAAETRSDGDIRCSEQVQEGIQMYFTEYLKLCPASFERTNKKLDEILLSLLHGVEITDSDFLNLKVEDPFFNRISDMRDML